MNKYEITYLTIDEQSHDATAIKDILAKHEAKIVSVHPWGVRRRLTYPIQKHDQAFYTTVVFEADSTAIKPIEDALRLSDKVLRSLVVIFEPGVFHRASPAATESTPPTEAAPTEKPVSKPELVENKKPTPKDKAVKTTEGAEETKPEDTISSAKEAAPKSAETTPKESEDKPKRGRKPAKTDDKSLDAKLDALLNEDITG